jgi:ABC-type nitrate/sulfonate/bicarbonate transport system substrate-binding protein
VPTAFGIATRNGQLEQDYRDAGVVFSSLATSTSPQVRQAHFEQNQPRSFRHGGNIPPLVAASRGTDVRFIGLSWAPSSSVILALPGSGIEGPEDLHGKRIAIPVRVNDSIDFWRASVLQGFERALGRAGLDWDDVEKVELPVERAFIGDSTQATGSNASLWDASFMMTLQREESTALINGTVDAIYSEGSNSVIAEAVTGARRVVDLTSDAPPPAFTTNQRPLTFTVAGELLDERPDLVDIALRRVVSVADWARGEEVEAKRAIAAEVGIAEELIDRSYSPTVHAGLDVSLDDALVDALQAQHDFLVEYGFIEQPGSVRDLIAIEPLQRVLAESGAAA